MFTSALKAIEIKLFWAFFYLSFRGVEIRALLIIVENTCVTYDTSFVSERVGVSKFNTSIVYT